MVIINFKGSDELKEAIRQVAFAKRVSPSKFIRDLIERNTLISNELKKTKKKVA